MTAVAMVPALRRLIAITLLVIMTPVTYANAACAGWSASAAERMACCQRAAAGCESLSADDCCAAQEQRQNLDAVAIVLISSGMIVSAPLPAAATVHSRVGHDPGTLAHTIPTHLLNSVFLI